MSDERSQKSCEHGSPAAGVELAEPGPVSLKLLARIHDQAYIDAIRTGHPRKLAGSPWELGPQAFGGGIERLG